MNLRREAWIRIAIVVVALLIAFFVDRVWK